MKRSQSPSPDSSGSSPGLIDAIARSMMFRTFARIYENEFGVPLYLESASRPGTLNSPRNESGFCTELNRGNGSCTGCPFNILPRPQTLMPWTWSSPCRLGQQVTLVPVTAGGKSIAWLVSGHYFVGEGAAGSRRLSDEVMREITADKCRQESLMHAYRKIRIIPKARHELMVRFLETCSALIGANLNRFLIGDGWENREQSKAAIPGLVGATFGDGSQSAERDLISAMGMGNEEIVTRTRLEKARRRFLRTQGLDADIGLAGKEAGWVDDGDFRQDFLKCIGESPSEHWRTITGLWSDFSKILANDDHQLIGSHP